MLRFGEESVVNIDKILEQAEPANTKVKRQFGDNFTRSSRKKLTKSISTYGELEDDNQLIEEVHFLSFCKMVEYLPA
ncbi:hypothetical protein QE152_g15765 [Popillia japonica]|uniref:Uncharacterized protein n=1 Tax=Popillia japonica TaxID=7064 RepID=A0AAW1L4Q1_POPJA